MKPLLIRQAGAVALWLPRSTCLWSSAACRDYCDAVGYHNGSEAQEALIALRLTQEAGVGSERWHRVIHRAIADLVLSSTGVLLVCAQGDIIPEIEDIVAAIMAEALHGGNAVIGFTRNLEWARRCYHERLGRVFFSVDAACSVPEGILGISIAHPEDGSMRLSTIPHSSSCSERARAPVATCDRCRREGSGCFHVG